MFPMRNQGIEHFLLEILHELPDMDFLVNTRDYPTSGAWRRPNNRPFPILSFSKQPNQHDDLTYPAWTFWKGGPCVSLYKDCLGRWDLMTETIKDANSEWEKKKDVAFFRGSRTSEERDPLVKLSRAKPELVQAAYTKNQGNRGAIDLLFAEPAADVHLKDHCGY